MNQEQNGHHYPGMEYAEDSSILTDEADHHILMHRDAHFGGDFNVMLTYYQEDQIGVYPDFEIERIAYLAEIEKQTGQDLAPSILTAPEAEVVARSRRAYESLKAIYEHEQSEKSPFPRLLADLILTENEEPVEETEAVVAYGTRIVPELLRILKSEDAYDPLFPGYGYAPFYAIVCLAAIKDSSAIIPLFETLGRDMEFEEEIILGALFEIGEPAKQFLLEVLQGRPLTKDTINAAFALTFFADQPDVSVACFEQLQDVQVRLKPLLRSYLLNNCEGLRGTPDQQKLKKMALDLETPPDFRKEIENMLGRWE